MRDQSYYSKQAWEQIERLAKGGLPFTADDVRIAIAEPPPFTNTLSALFSNARRRGLISPMGSAVSRRTSARGRKLTIYVGAAP